MDIDSSHKGRALLLAEGYLLKERYSFSSERDTASPHRKIQLLLRGIYPPLIEVYNVSS